MREIIIIKTNESEKIRNFLNQERVNYEVYHDKKNQEDKAKKQKDIFRKQLIADYQDAAQDKELNRELTDWDKAVNDGLSQDYE